MSECIIIDDSGILRQSTNSCDFMLLNESEFNDFQSLISVSDQLNYTDVMMIFSAICSVYALVFVIKIVLTQLGFRS